MPKYNIAAGERRQLHGVIVVNESHSRVHVWFNKTTVRGDAGAYIIGEQAWQIEAEPARGERAPYCEVQHNPTNGHLVAMRFSDVAG